jgi:hypothetical protein
MAMSIGIGMEPDIVCAASVGLSGEDAFARIIRSRRHCGIRRRPSYRALPRRAARVDPVIALRTESRRGSRENMT